MWTAVNRNELSLFEFEIGSAEKSTWLNMVFRIEKYCKINHLCTDANPVYGYYKVANQHHVSKAETSLVESWNCRLRHYLARLKRKTLCYSKCANALRIAILMFIHKHIALSVFR